MHLGCHPYYQETKHTMKQPRLVNLRCHRPVNWSESQVTQALARSGYVLGEFKEDGFRFHAFILEGEVRVVTREGIEIRSLEERKRFLRGLLETLPAGFIIDGEVVIPGIPFEDASGILRRFEPVPEMYVTQFYVWDTMPYSSMSGIESDSTPYVERKRFLLQKFNEVPYPSIFVSYHSAGCLRSLAEIQGFFETARKYKKEGAVIKDPDSGVRNGKVQGAWKLKPSDTADGRVVGLVWGTPGLANEGLVVGFTVELEDGVRCDATNITQEQMREYTAGANANWDTVNPYNGRYCRVGYMERTKTGSLRHPTFLDFRDLEYAPGIKA